MGQGVGTVESIVKGKMLFRKKGNVSGKDEIQNMKVMLRERVQFKVLMQ